ncbi:hypothetical protein [Kordia jejudonensis]|uniref:hypothetical protein n=1 Tax=Kordia jejudonensis TaxID=1348245 RepID=UPI000629C800|nr:hypothetical protein [Kordia jejudonensis]
MNEENHIVDTQLPLTLDFKSLKAAGLAYIQKHSTTAWTNLNPSDPGVTILEQLCYAFTELGYCGNFPMKDILTQKDGTLQVENQFYTPKEILTTSPITIQDYTKLVIDQISAVKNILFKPVTTSFSFVQGMYEVYLLLDINYTDNTVDDNPEFDTFFLLNTYRNVGEVFAMPTTLVEKTYTITGNLELQSGYHYQDVLPEIMQSINQYIFPDVTQTGYDVLRKEGTSTNAIFEGPILKNGWIPTESIQPKRDAIQPFEITKLIHDINGVQSISKVTFLLDGKEIDTAICAENEILRFDFTQSIKNTLQLAVHSDGKQHNFDVNASVLEEFGNMQQPASKVHTVAAVVTEPSLPTGKFRDITNYYAIQNTFPDSYKIGTNAVNKNTPAYQVAQSRQLKGYLNMFDQMLSNQFAQLANIDKLFSFKNTATGNPADLENYNATKTKEEKEQPKYPAPFQAFSPTYFYQSLYDSVPNIEPLLRDYTTFNFGPVLETEQELAQKKWTRYKEDPYNGYMYGLLVATEEDNVNLKRRNDLLDHVLARHGVSPAIIDTLIYGTIYSGDVLKDRVIIKSVYLQNFALLSYNRAKSYNYIGAQKLHSYHLTITAELIEELTQKDTLIPPNEQEEKLTKEEKQAALLAYEAKTALQQILKHSYETNGIFDSVRFDTSQKLTSQDVINYNTIELEASLLLTLQPYYINFIQETALYQELTPKKQTEIDTAFWLYTQRKGFITIETNLLLQSASFKIYIKKVIDPLDGRYMYYSNTTMLSYHDFITQTSAFDTMTSDAINSLVSDTSKWETSFEVSTAIASDTFDKLGSSAYTYTVQVSWENAYTCSIHNSIFDNTLLFFFPDFIPEMKTTAWQNRLSYFMESQLPLQISQDTKQLSEDTLKNLIPKYIDWYNATIYTAKTTTETQEEVAAKRKQETTTSTGHLVAYVDTIYTENNA